MLVEHWLGLTLVVLELVALNADVLQEAEDGVLLLDVTILIKFFII